MILDTISAIEITEPQTKIEEKDNTGILRDNFSSETHPSETGLEGGARGARLPPPLSFTITCLFCNHFEELQTVFIEVKLIINNAPLTYVYY